MTKRFQFRLRTLLLVVVPVLVVALPFGWYLRPELLRTVPVSGSVTLDGVPLDGAMISFATADSRARPAFGNTDKAGRFRLWTPIRRLPVAKGALPGTYQVTIQKFVIRFRNTTPLMVQVTEDGPNDFAFNLTTP